MIQYVDTIEGIAPEQLQGFFEGWPNPPSPETHLRILAAADHVVLAVDGDSGQVVGFINAISDGVLADATIPLLEVLPAYRGQGIGSELVRRMRARPGDLYAVDLMCDPEVQPFYESLGMHPAVGMRMRNYALQSGKGE